MDTPLGLADGGTALWISLADKTTSTSQRVLLTEACRIVDRLDRMDRQLADREVWWELIEPVEGGDLTIVVDKALAESRQQAVVLRQLLTTLGVDKISHEAGKGSALDDLNARRAARLAAAAAS